MLPARRKAVWRFTFFEINGFNKCRETISDADFSPLPRVPRLQEFPPCVSLTGEYGIVPRALIVVFLFAFHQGNG